MHERDEYQPSDKHLQSANKRTHCTDMSVRLLSRVRSHGMVRAFVHASAVAPYELRGAVVRDLKL